jgi:hypothetical protein
MERSNERLIFFIFLVIDRIGIVVLRVQLSIVWQRRLFAVLQGEMRLVMILDVIYTLLTKLNRANTKLN